MILYLSTNRERTLENPTKQQIRKSLDELLSFTDDPKLENESFLVLAVERYGFMKKLRPPILQVMASAYGWFVEYVDEAGSEVHTMRNSVSEQDLHVAFLGFLENSGRPDNLSWRQAHVRS